MIDENLKQWATETQAKYIDAVNQYGSINKAAKALNKRRSTVGEGLALVKKKAALSGYSPDHAMTKVAPDPFIVKGVSTYYNADGVPSGQWVKTSLDNNQRIELIKQAVSAFLEDVPKINITRSPKEYDNDIIPWIQIGDGHVGMLAHAAEVGNNFDLKIAEREVCCAIGMLIDELFPVERLVLNDLGDFTHYENMSATTEASGHALDFDSRFHKMIRAYSRIMRYMIEKALEKAKHVDVIINRGNHSETNDIWMAELLRAAYGHTGRVNVLDNDSMFIGYRMGNTLVMTHHGHKARHKDLVGVMITDYRKDFGETQFHYIDTGHIHHAMVLKEYPSVVIESFNNLPPNDRWAHDSGYRSRKAISVILRSKTFGEVGRRLLPIEEIQARLNKAEGVSLPKEKKAYTV